MHLTTMGGVTTPTEMLDVNGNINFNGKITRTNSGNAELTPLCWGMPNSVLNGGVRAGTSHLSITRIGFGHYHHLSRNPFQQGSHCFCLCY